MTVHVLTREQTLPGSPDTVFPFFAAARNLEAITPPWLGFRVVTPEPIAMAPGALIDYRLRLHGIPLRWKTRIAEWEPGERFVDEQLRGPYALWHHTHEFAPAPTPAARRAAHRHARHRPLRAAARAARRASPTALLVRRDLDRIFDFRAAEVARRLSAGG